MADGSRTALTDPEQNDPGGDAALMARIAGSRDRAAFAALFERYAGRVKAFMIRSGAAPDAAEEAVQEAFISVWRRAETFDAARASVAAWIFAIARNKRVDMLRRGARPEPDPTDPSFLPDPPEQPDAALSGVRRDAAVREALGGLTEDQRVVVHLSFYEGRPHSEIAEMLGLPLGTVKSRLRLAFGRLRGALDAHRDDDDAVS
jgi:RNA polymerase sigma-70 factor (ECF subfamily)